MPSLAQLFNDITRALGPYEPLVKQILAVLDTAEPFKEISERRIKKVPVLRGKTIVNLFFEASTRTRISFAPLTVGHRPPCENPILT